MIYIGSKEKLFQKWKSDFIKELDERKPLSIEDLQFAFTGQDGHNYYHFPDHNLMPLERFAVRKSIMAWMYHSIDPKEMENLLDTLDLAVDSGVKGIKGSASVIGFISKAIRERKSMEIHTNLLYHFVAIHYIRDDERADTYVDKIQIEKVAAFKIENEIKGSSFFLTKNELKDLYDMSKMSESEWITFWHESLIKQEALKQMLTNIKSELPIG